MKECKGSYSNRSYMTCSKDDRQIIDMLVDNARDYLINYVGMSEDDIKQQLDDIYVAVTYYLASCPVKLSVIVLHIIGVL